MLVQYRHLGFGQPVFENRCPDHFRWRKVGVLGQLPQKFHLLLSHPESIPEGAFLFFFFWWSCHFIDEQSELKVPRLCGGKRFGLTKTWLAPRNEAIIWNIHLDSCFLFDVRKDNTKRKKSY